MTTEDNNCLSRVWSTGRAARKGPHKRANARSRTKWVFILYIKLYMPNFLSIDLRTANRPVRRSRLT